MTVEELLIKLNEVVEAHAGDDVHVRVGLPGDVTIDLPVGHVAVVTRKRGPMVVIMDETSYGRLE